MMKTKIDLVSKTKIRILVTRGNFRQQKHVTAFIREKHLITRNESDSNDAQLMARKAARLLGSCERRAAMAELTNRLITALGLSCLRAREFNCTNHICVCDRSPALRSWCHHCGLSLIHSCFTRIRRRCDKRNPGVRISNFLEIAQEFAQLCNTATSQPVVALRIVRPSSCGDSTHKKHSDRIDSQK